MRIVEQKNNELLLTASKPSKEICDAMWVNT